MNITFNQNEELNYEAEFKVEGDFNLHIERVSKGPIYLMQRGTSEGEYSNSTVLDNNDDTLDYDFAALVYPKYIKVVSGSEVVNASVNFNEGGGSGSDNEVKWEYYKVVNFSEIPHETLYPASTYANFGDRIDNTSLAYSDNVQRELIKSVAGTNIPLIYIDTMETFIVDKGSWKLNVMEFYGIDENKFNEHFIPITKEEFYSLE